MRPDALHFRRVAVRRMPGIADGGFALEGLSPGINVIHGPNASGKTTTARSIEKLLWPHGAGPERATVAAEFALGGSGWSVDVDVGRVRYQRDGAEAPGPVLPGAEGRDRYRLALHELIGDDNAGLAAEIVRESAGGYDLAAAAQALGARSSVSRPRGEYAALTGAEEQLQQARDRQARLRLQESELDDMTRRLRRAEAAAERVRLLERAIEHAEAVARADAARRELQAFDPILERVNGDEAERLQGLAARRDAALEKLDHARRDLAAAADASEATGLGDDAAGAAMALRELKESIRGLEELERNVRSLEEELGAAGSRRDEERRLIGDAVTDERLAALDVRAVEAWADFADRADDLWADRRALDAEIRRLEEEAGARDEPEPLEEAVRLLRRWLRAGGGARTREQRLRALALAAAAALAVGGVAAGVTGAGLAAVIPFALAAVGVLLAGLVFRVGTAPGPDAAAVHQADYERLGLDSPARWADGEVAELLDRLERRLARARVGEEHARRLADARRRREELQPELDAMESRRAELVERLGIAPDSQPARVAYLSQRISRWQDANGRAVEVAQRVEQARALLAEALSAAGGRLAGLGYPDPGGVSGLRAAADDLDARMTAHGRAEAALRDAERRLNEAREELDRLDRERRDMLDRAQLEDSPGVETRVAELCAQVEAYKAARERRLVAERHGEELAVRLRDTPGFGLDLVGRDADALRAELEAERREAAQQAQLREEIATLRAMVEHAKRSHDVEDALATVERCLAALRDVRDRDTLAVAADVLIRFVQQATRDQHRPEVFHRARDQFLRITHGRYRLDFDDGEPPAFRALDTTTAVGHPLDELSSATRVQLLLAVRLAFVETIEAGVRLPLILDETLGNSDDQRATAIMDAVATLAAEGRQVFYFTAQPDEVGKWRAILDARPDVPARFIDLAEARRVAGYAELTPLKPAAPPSPRVPAPEGASYEAYGQALGVPAVDVYGDPGAMHLWHLMDDAEALYRILARGFERWGALKELARHGGLDLLGDDAASYPRIAAAARALEAAVEAARIGRGRPVDRAVLVDSGAVSDTFLDRVDDLCSAVDGDPARLLRALEDGEVPRFRNDARESLAGFLEKRGYLDPDPPLDAEAIRVRTLAAVATEIREGVLAQEQVERMLARLPALVTA